MTTYAQTLASDSKRVRMVYDFPDLQTRFVSSATEDLATPSGWTVFEGAVPEPDKGARLDPGRGRLSVGGTAFRIPDVDQAITAWLQQNDGALFRAVVYRREGFDGVPEADWTTSAFLLEDVAADGDAGGGYRLELDNAIGDLSRGLWESLTGESKRLDPTAHASGLLPAASTITLATSPKGDWREPGLALLWDPDARVAELVAYSSIGGTGDLDLQSVIRHVFAIGDQDLDGTSDTTFSEETAQVFEVWAWRGSPIDFVAQVLSKSDAGGENSFAVSTGRDPGLDDWATSSDLTYHTELTTGGTVAEEATEVLYSPGSGGRSARFDRTGAGNLGLYLPNLNFSGVTSYWSLASPAIKGAQRVADGFSIAVLNQATGNYLQADKTWGASVYRFPFDVEARWTRPVVTFEEDPAGSSTDLYRLEYLFEGATGDVFYLDGDPSNHWRSGWTSEPNGPFDTLEEYSGAAVVTGELLAVDYRLLDLARFDEVRESLWPAPTFAGSGALSTGTAVLFCERKPIDDAKDFIEEHALRPFGLFLTVGADERLGVESFFRATDTKKTIGDEWNRRDFRVSAWKRNFRSRVNVCRLLTDWNPVDEEHDRGETSSQESSIGRFRRSKNEELAGRGCRTGQLGFPDYGSLDDLRSGASRIMLDLGNPWTPIRVRAHLKHKDVRIGGTVGLNISELPNLATGSRGVATDETFVVDRRRIVVDRETAHVELELRLRRTVIRPAIVAPNSVASSYSSASSADRAYCYLTPDADGSFANGDEAYTVVS